MCRTLCSNSFPPPLSSPGRSIPGGPFCRLTTRPVRLWLHLAPSLNISSYRQQRVKLSFFLQPVSLCLFISECSHLRLFLKEVFTNSCRSICYPFSGSFYFYFLPLSKRGYCIGRDGLLLVFLFIYPFILSNLPTHLHSTWIKINPVLLRYSQTLLHTSRSTSRLLCVWLTVLH